VWNVSCANSNVWRTLPGLEPWSVTLSVVLMLLAAAIIVANLITLLVLTDRRYVGVAAIAVSNRREHKRTGFRSDLISLPLLSGSE